MMKKFHSQKAHKTTDALEAELLKLLEETEDIHTEAYQAAHTRFRHEGEFAFLLMVRLINEADKYPRQAYLALRVLRRWLIMEGEFFQRSWFALLELLENQPQSLIQMDVLNALLAYLIIRPKSPLLCKLFPLLLHEDVQVAAQVARHVRDKQIAAATPYLVVLLEDGGNLTYLAADTLRRFGTAEALFALYEWEKRR